MSAAVLYETTVRHTRLRPKRRSFQHRSYLWLVDLDHLPVLPWWLAPFARFDARDHGERGGDSAGGSSIRAELDTWLAGHGVDLGGGRVRMLASARVAGYVFNPLTVYWCYGPDGRLCCVVAEVHNTYGGRHRYLLRPDARGIATADKRLYVSPFITVDGSYRLAVPEPGDQLHVSVSLRQHDYVLLTTVLRGRRRPATVAHLLRMLLRYPFAPLAGAVAIRLRGIGLWLHGLPVVPRPRIHQEAPR